MMVKPLRPRWARRWLVVATLLVRLLISPAHADPGDHLFLVANDLRAEIARASLIHDYGAASLVRVPQVEDLTPDLRGRLHRLPAMDHVVFRSWSTALPAPAHEPDARKGYYLLALVGPVDQRWLDELDLLGLRVVASGHPYAVVVKADGALLTRAMEIRTSGGTPVVRGVVSLPPQARMSRDLIHLVTSTKAAIPLELRVQAFDPAMPTAAAETSMLAPADLVAWLAGNPEISYVEPAYSIRMHNNLAVKEHILDVEPVWWDLGYNGSEIVINHNDTGVDLSHPDLPPEVVVATVGKMIYTDTGHGTHTAASAVGRGTVAAPTNTFDCGDASEPLPDLRGVAWGATLAVNNVLGDGLDDVTEMMRWGVRQGATISTNSWGVDGPLYLVTNYSSASAAVDAAVRDGDPSTDENEELAIFFSAGNYGPFSSSVTAPATAKNAITVGASQNDRCGSYVPDSQDGPDPNQVLTLSGRGPSQGRVKPDLVAPGADVLSAESGDSEATTPWDLEWTGDLYALGTGTSMSCPLAAGSGAVFAEFFWRTTGTTASPALIKAALINGATDLGLERELQGWGRIDLRRSIEGPENGAVTFVDQRETEQLVTGNRWQHDLVVFSHNEPLRITLVWSDVPAEHDSDHPLRNDLDLVVTAPDGTIYRGNRLIGSWSMPDPGAEGDSDNPVENVFIEIPVAGEWRVEVVAVNVAENPHGLSGQDFALVYSGDAADCEAPPAPGGVLASSIADNRIEVSWTELPEAQQYAIYRSTSAGGRPYEPLAEVAAPASSYLDATVSGGITYYYVVRTFTECWSEASAEASATATGACHLAPAFAGLTSVVDGEAASCTLELQWQPAASLCGGDVEYTVYRTTEAELTPGPETEVASGITGTAFSDIALTDGEVYSYAVRATDLSNGQTESNTNTLTAAPSGPDWVFFNEDGETGSNPWLMLPGSAADSGTAPWALTESDAHSPTRSWFCSDDDVVKDQALVLADAVAVPGDVPTKLELWHRHVFESRWDGGRLEYSTDGKHTWHDMLDGDGFAIPANPGRFLEGAYNDTLTVGRSENPLAGEEGWTGRSPGWVKVVVDLSDFANHSINLRWRLACDEGTSVDGGWWVDDVQVVYATPCQSCFAPPPPQGVTATADGAGVRLTWTPVDGAVEYRIFRATSNGGPYNHLATVGAASTDWLDLSTSGATTYHYVLEVLTDCLSGFSEQVSVTAVGPCTLAPEFWGLDSAVNPGAPRCALDLSWREAASQCSGSSAGYRVYRSADPDFEPTPSTYFTTVTAAASYRDGTMGDGDVMHYIVRAYDTSNLNEDLNLRRFSAMATGPETEVFGDDLEGGDGAWTFSTGSAADSGTEPWSLATTDSHSPATSFFCANEEVVKDQVVALNEPVAVPDGREPVLEFWHRFSLEFFFDGGRLEYSTDDGATWQDILDGDGASVPVNGDRFLAGRYTATLSHDYGTPPNPLVGERAWSGIYPWHQVRVDLADFAGLDVLFRWRLGCDGIKAFEGWWVDDVRVSYITRCTARHEIPPRQGGVRVP